MARDRCVGCHEPGHAGDGGIGCVTCHAAVGNRSEQDAELVVELAAPLAGPIADAAPTDAHGSRQGEFLTSASLCLTCHEVTGPALFVEPTRAEYEASFAPGEGLTCADCHMPARDDGPWVEGGATRPRTDHRFIGFDPPWGASAAEAADAAKRTRALLAVALDLELLEDDLEPGESGAFTIALTNSGAGHAVPTGVALLREIWIELRLIDATDATIVHLGALDAGGRPIGQASPLELGDQPLADGAPIAVPTDADDLLRRALAPDERREVRVATDLGVPPIRAEATLRARAIRADTMIALGLEGRLDELPVHQVETASAP